MSILRLAQTFDVSGSFVPTKASVYLKRVGSNSTTYFDLDHETITTHSVDASNHARIVFSTHKLLFDDTDIDATGTGHLIVNEFFGDSSSSTYSYAEYPVRASGTPGRFNLALRVKAPGGSLNASVLIDGSVVDTIDATVAAGWNWVTTSFFVLPDTSIHNLGIRLEDNNDALDKILISSSTLNPSGSGPSLTESPFVTIHMQVYQTDGKFSPTSALRIYDFKNSIDDIKRDDWFNFDITPIDASISISFDGVFALVMSSSGGTAGNYVLWEILDSDEYFSMPSAIRV